MAVQTLIALGIVFTAAGIALYRIIKSLTNPLKKCNGCGKGCGGCSLEDLKHEIELKKSLKREENQLFNSNS
jgi:hypothetical protein